MKINVLLITLSACLLTAVGCGKKMKIHEGSDEASNKLGCGESKVTGASQSQAFDYEIIFTSSTIEKVLSDVRSKSHLKVNDFWSTLSPETRYILNYELNMVLTKARPPSQLSAFQSTALFFTTYKNSYRAGNDYRIKDQLGRVFSFTQKRPTKSTSPGEECYLQKRVDLSDIKVGPEVFLASDIEEVYECRSADKSFILMEGRDGLFMSSKQSVYRIKTKEYAKDDSRLRIILTIDSPTISLFMSLKKNKDGSVEDFHGKKTAVELMTPFETIQGEMICDSLKYSLEV